MLGGILDSGIHSKNFGGNAVDKVTVQGIVVVQVILVVMLTNGYIFGIVKNQIPQKQLQS